MTVFQNVFLLSISTVLVLLVLIILLRTKTKSQLKTIFITILNLLIFWFVFLILQLVVCNKTGVNPIIFENFIYIAASLVPVFILLLSISFVKNKIKFTKKYLLLFVVPVISLVVLWTNKYHNLFYIKYSTNIGDTEFGPYFPIYSIYSYGCVFLGIVLLLKYSIRNAGLFSKQSVFFVIGTSFSVLLSLFSAIGVLDLSIYATPISFTIAVLCYSIAIFKFSFLSVAPIALQRIVDRISDSYIILDENGNITDFNKTLLDTFKVKDSEIRKKFIGETVKAKKLDINIEILKEAINVSRKMNKTIRHEKYINTIDKYFNIEITSIFSDDIFLGTIILLKDITQHMEDIKTIKSNQDTLMEQERLASLGQLIGGISHNLKTPIMSISGAAEGLNDLIKEYEVSIGDEEVTIEDHHEIAKDMYKWTKKIKEYTEYMSDIITTVKGQAVTLSSEKDVEFTIDELIKRVDILMRHELKNALITLNTNIQIEPTTILAGDVNGLVQVVNNLISNAIQAYNGETQKQINLDISKENNNIIIAVQDFGMGMSDNVKKKLFKEMITTKGKNGSGLGLFMSYSTIKAHFKGDLTFESEKGKGTTFYIKIPMQ